MIDLNKLADNINETDNTDKKKDECLNLPNFFDSYFEYFKQNIFYNLTKDSINLISEKVCLSEDLKVFQEEMKLDKINEKLFNIVIYSLNKAISKWKVEKGKENEIVSLYLRFIMFYFASPETNDKNTKIMRKCFSDICVKYFVNTNSHITKLKIIQVIFLGYISVFLCSQCLVWEYMFLNKGEEGQESQVESINNDKELPLDLFKIFYRFENFKKTFFTNDNKNDGNESNKSKDAQLDYQSSCRQ